MRSQITTMRPAAPGLDPADAAQREQLSFEINSLRQTIASLRIQVAYPELATADPATLEADLARSEALMERLSVGLADLPTVETTSTTETLDMLVLQRHLQDLEARYVSISLSLLEQPDAIGPIGNPFYIDQTRDELGLLLAGPGGLLAGVLAMLVLLLLADRIKRPLRALEDVQPLTPIGVIDRARPGAGVRPWYPRAGQARRRRQVQALRAALDRAVGDGAVSVSLVGVSVPESDVQALAADLAASVAASGHRVLLIDSCFGRPSDLPEYGSEYPDLADLIIRRDTEDAVAIIKQALADRHEVLTDLHALRAGSAADDAADALAGRQFRALLGAAAELDELVVMAAPSFGDPGTEVLSQRVDYLVLVCAARRTTRRRYEEAIDDLSDRYATLFGTVLLEGRSLRARRTSKSKSKGSRRTSRRERRATSDETPVAVAEPLQPVEELPVPLRSADPPEQCRGEDPPGTAATSGHQNPSNPSPCSTRSPRRLRCPHRLRRFHPLSPPNPRQVIERPVDDTTGHRTGRGGLPGGPAARISPHRSLEIEGLPRRAGRRERRATSHEIITSLPPVPAPEPLKFVEELSVPLRSADPPDSAEEKPARHRGNVRTPEPVEPEPIFHAKSPPVAMPPQFEALPPVEPAPPQAVVETSVETPPVVAPAEATMPAAPEDRPAAVPDLPRPSLRDRLLPPPPGPSMVSRTPVPARVLTEADSGVEIIIDDRAVPDMAVSDRRAAERYLVDGVLALVGVGNDESARRLGVVDEEGMVPITAVAGTNAAAARLEQVLSADAANRSEGVDRGLIDLLGEDRNSLRRWIEQEFFALHTRLSDGNPTVWHLSSTNGAFQALVTAKSFDADHIQLLRSHDVRRAITGLRRSLDDVGGVGEDARAEEVRKKIEEVRAFDQALAELLRRGWRTGGRPDRNADLAALRDLGLLVSAQPGSSAS